LISTPAARALGAEVRALVKADRLDAARERLLDGLRG
jgi:hypothetical protein